MRSVSRNTDGALELGDITLMRRRFGVAPFNVCALQRSFVTAEHEVAFAPIDPLQST